MVDEKVAKKELGDGVLPALGTFLTCYWKHINQSKSTLLHEITVILLYSSQIPFCNSSEKFQ